MAARDELAAAISERLSVEAHLERDEGEVDRARLLAPGLFDPARDHSNARRLLARADRTGGWWAGHRAVRARSRVGLLAEASDDATCSELGAALDLAVSARALADLIAEGGLDLDAAWTRLEACEADVHRLVGRWLSLEADLPLA